jgi:hypothetical protein
LLRARLANRDEKDWSVAEFQQSWLEENVKTFSPIARVILRNSARTCVWVNIVLLLGALVQPPASLAQAGFVDPSFLNGMTGPNSWLWAGALQSDGKLLLGGQFASFNGLPRGPVARLNVDGSVDTNSATRMPA